MTTPQIPIQSPQRAAYEQKYNTSRFNLLLTFAFTAINLCLLVTNANSYFLFSAFVPYYIAGLGMMLCGRFPAEFYEGEIEGAVFLPDTVFTILLIVSIVCTLLYLFSWFMSRKQRAGWLIFALVLFVIDTAAMLLLNGIALDSIIDILFHAWVIYYLALGIHASRKLKSLPPDDGTVPAAPVFYTEAAPQPASDADNAATPETAPETAPAPENGDAAEGSTVPDQTQTPNT